MFFSAAMGVMLGILLLREWPLSGLWAIGTLVGINLAFSGFSIISVGSARGAWRSDWSMLPADVSGLDF
jgi:uncharacterized membrane protein HdeD (DUF308 family)